MLDLPTLMMLLYICVFVVGVSLLTKAIPHFRRTEIRWLIVFVLALCWISFCSLNVYIRESLEDKMLFSRMRFVGLSVLGQSWFFFLSYTYGARRFFHHPLFVTLSLLPALGTITMVLVPSLHSMLVNHYELFVWQGMRLVRYSAGGWFSVHIVSANLFAFASIFYAFFSLRRLKGIRRNQLFVLVFGCAFSLVVDFFCTSTSHPLRWAMLSGGTLLLAEAAILYAVVKHALLDLAPIAKDQIFEKVPDPVLLIDDQERLVDFNDSAKKLFGLHREDLYERWRDLDAFREFDLDQVTMENFHVPGEKEERCFHLMTENFGSPRAGNGRILLFREITAQKMIETRLNRDLEFKARLLTMIAHDFSGVLHAQAFLSADLGQKVEPGLRGRAGALADSMFASQDFMTNVLQWAKSQNQETQFRPLVRPFELNTLVRDVVVHLESVWKARDLTIRFHEYSGPIVVHGDAIMIESVIRNLMTNAIRASAMGQTIELRVVRTAHEVHVLVQDCGVGMSAATIEVLHSDQTDLGQMTGVQGFGVGLTIARRFVALHGGRLGFVSTPGQGTSVTLTLPL